MTLEQAKRREHFINLYGSIGVAVQTMMLYTGNRFSGAPNAQALMRCFRDELTPEQVLHCQAVVLKHKLKENR